jgi:hypothetical protein
VSFKCRFGDSDTPVRIGINLARARATFGTSPHTLVEVDLVAKNGELALLPGGNENADPQIRIQYDGTAVLRAKVYPSVRVVEQHGKCEKT